MLVHLLGGAESNGSAVVEVIADGQEALSSFVERLEPGFRLLSDEDRSGVVGEMSGQRPPPEHVERVSISRWLALALNGPPIALLLSAAYAAISLGARDALIPMLFFYFFLQASVLFLLNRYGVMTLRISQGVLRVSYAGGELRIPASAVEIVCVDRVSALRVPLLVTKPSGRTLSFAMRGGPAIRLRLGEPIRTAVGVFDEVLISTTRPHDALRALELNGFPTRPGVSCPSTGRSAG